MGSHNWVFDYNGVPQMKALSQVSQVSEACKIYIIFHVCCTFVGVAVTVVIVEIDPTADSSKEASFIDPTDVSTTATDDRLDEVSRNLAKMKNGTAPKDTGAMKNNGTVTGKTRAATSPAQLEDEPPSSNKASIQLDSVVENLTYGQI